MREGTYTASGTYQVLTGDGAGGTLQDIIVPDGAQSIKQISMSIGGATTASWYGFIVRLSGTGSKNGDQYVALAGCITVGTGVVHRQAGITPVDVDIPVQPGTLQIAVSAAWNTDPGTPEVAVYLTFSSEAGANSYYMLRANTADLATDTWTTLSSDGGGASVGDMIVPGSVSAIKQVRTLTVGGQTAAVASVHYRLVSIGGAFRNGDSEAYFPGSSQIYGAGSLTSADIVEGITMPCDIPVGPGQIRAQYAHGGGDTDYPIGIIQVVFA